jgi:hypothetical protein
MTQNNKCPDFDEISAWHDNETTADYSQHVRSCTDCQEIIADLKKMDSSLFTLLDSAQPQNSLKDKIIERAQAPVKAPLYFKHIVKVAAVLAIAFTVNHFLQKDSNTTSIELSKTSPEPKAIPTMSAIGEDSTVSPIEESPKSEISSQDFSLVSIEATEHKTSIEAAAIKAKVNHVWVCEDINETKISLNQRFAKNEISSQRIGDSGSLHFTLKLTEKNLSKEVNWLAKKNLKLVSSDFPQPNQASTSTTPNRVVTYQITIIKKK